MFKTMTEIKKANKKAGSHWFEKATMDFFGTIIEEKILFGKYFFTQDRVSSACNYRYSIRRANKNGSIDTIGQFHKYFTMADAEKALSHHMVEIGELVE